MKRFVETALVTLILCAAGLIHGCGRNESLSNDSAATDGTVESGGVSGLTEGATASAEIPFHFTVSRLLPRTSPLYLRVNTARLLDSTEDSALSRALGDRAVVELIGEFERSLPPRVTWAAGRVAELFTGEMHLALHAGKGGDGSRRFHPVLGGTVADGTREAQRLFAGACAPLLAGEPRKAVRERVRGLLLEGRTGPAGGIFWVFDGDQFLVSNSRASIEGILAESERTAAAGAEQAFDRIAGATEPHAVLLFLDFARAGEAGILPPRPDPNAPLLFSLLKIAQGAGYESALIAYDRSDGPARIRLSVRRTEPVSPAWAEAPSGSGFYSLLPRDTQFAVGGILPSPSGNESSPKGAGSATESVFVRAKELIPDRDDLLRSVLRRSEQPMVIGLMPLEAARNSHAWFASIPRLDRRARRDLVDWVYASGGTVAEVTWENRALLDLELSGSPVLRGSEFENLVVASEGGRTCIATHPDAILRMMALPGPDALASGRDFEEVAVAIAPRALIRGYVSPEFLFRVLGVELSGLEEQHPFPPGTAGLVRLTRELLAPVHLAVFLEKSNLTVELASVSDVAPPAAFLLLHHLATRLLTERGGLAAAPHASR